MTRQFKPGQLQTGSLYNISSSYAVTASYAANAGVSIDTGSLVTTASFNAFTASYATGSFTGSFIGNLIGTASWANNALTASYVNPLQQNVQLTGSLYLSAPGLASIYFTGSGTPGQLTWNDTDGTLELGLKGGVVRTELGQGLVTRIVNKTVPNVDLSGSNYQVVVVAGAQGQRLAVKLAQADNDANSAGTLGIIAEDIAKNQEGFIVTVGLLKNRNTTGALQGETWSDGDILYLSPTTAGAITNIKPQAPQHTVIVGYVEYAHANNGKIYVKIDNGYEIDELHNVQITTASLSTGQLLVRSGSNNSGVWINTNQLTGSYGLTGSLTATSFTGSLFGTASYADHATNADVAGAIDIYSFGADVDSYILISNVIGTSGVAVGGDADLRYNSNTNKLTVGSVSATSFTGSLQGTASYATQALSASYAPSSPAFPYTGSARITGSLSVTGSIYTDSIIYSPFTIGLNFETATSYTYKTPYAFKVNSIESDPSGSLTMIYQASGSTEVTSSYIIGDVINKFDKLIITPATASLIVLNSIRI